MMALDSLRLQYLMSNHALSTLWARNNFCCKINQTMPVITQLYHLSCWKRELQKIVFQDAVAGWLHKLLAESVKYKRDHVPAVSADHVKIFKNTIKSLLQYERGVFLFVWCCIVFFRSTKIGSNNLSFILHQSTTWLINKFYFRKFMATTKLPSLSLV